VFIFHKDVQKNGETNKHLLSMEKENFENLIKLVTGKNLSVTSNNIELETEYSIFLNDEFNFTFKTPKKIDDKNKI
jgi:hypothetical protein